MACLKRNIVESVTWILVWPLLKPELPPEIATLVCNYLFDEIPCNICGKFANVHNNFQCSMIKANKIQDMIKKKENKLVEEALSRCVRLK
jgi:hypothetical protein